MAFQCSSITATLSAGRELTTQAANGESSLQCSPVSITAIQSSMPDQSVPVSSPSPTLSPTPLLHKHLLCRTVTLALREGRLLFVISTHSKSFVTSLLAVASALLTRHVCSWLGNLSGSDSEQFRPAKTHTVSNHRSSSWNISAKFTKQ